MSNRLKNKKMRMKCANIKALHSLNELHDLKHMNTVSRDTEELMLQRNMLKPRKLLSVGSRIPKLR